MPGVCTANGTQPPRTAYVNQGTATIPGANSTAQSSYCNPPTPAITIVKYTNGVEAGDPDGSDVPQLSVGEPVTWTYKVTNTGNVAIPKAQVVVTDNQPGVTPAFDQEITGNGDESFDPGEVWLFEATGTAFDLLDPPAGVIVVPGVCTGNGTQPPRTAYVNQGTATIPGANSTAQSSYCNPLLPAITIVKYTNGVEASDPDGADVPLIKVGDPVTWTYKVTNTGDVAVPKDQVSVTDNQPGVVPAFDQEITGNGDESFDPGEIWLYKATGTAVDLLDPPAGVIVVPGVCTANGTQPPRTAYVNQGTATIPGANSTAQSSYCNLRLYKLYFPMGMVNPKLQWETSIGFEDLPLQGVAGNQNDYDYNDWLLDINGEFFYDPSGLSKITFEFTPQARGAEYQHAFHMLFPANIFASNGASVLTIYDQNNNVISTQNIPFVASAANDYTVFANTGVIFPGGIINTIEGKAGEPALPKRKALLTIEFAAPFPFDLESYKLVDAHGDGLFFNPYINVVNTGDRIDAGDVRMLVIPESDWLWPEERVRIDTTYTDVVFTPGNPPTIIFPSGWWGNYNNCVYNGIACSLRRAR